MLEKAIAVTILVIIVLCAVWAYRWATAANHYTGAGADAA